MVAFLLWPTTFNQSDSQHLLHIKIFRTLYLNFRKSYSMLCYLCGQHFPLFILVFYCSWQGYTGWFDLYRWWSTLNILAAHLLFSGISLLLLFKNYVASMILNLATLRGKRVNSGDYLYFLAMIVKLMIVFTERINTLFSSS